MNWRLIDSGYNTGSMNMAIDEALLDSKVPVLRFYGWKPATVSLGYTQKLDKEIDIEACNRLGVDIVRRITGGKAVLHDLELTYSFICDEKMLPKSIVESYRIISGGILKALKSLKLNAEMKDKNIQKLNSAICFEEPSWYEITVDGKKIVGSAQKRVNGKILQHGAILIDLDINKQIEVFKVDDKSKIKKMMLDRVTWINKEVNNNLKNNTVYKINKDPNKINKKISYSDVAKAMKNGFEQNFNITFNESCLSKDELIKAKKLEKEKYSQKSWNNLF